MLYVFYIATTPYLPCNNKNINQKELYDFYYTAITLTTGYNKTFITRLASQRVLMVVHSDDAMMLLVKCTRYARALLPRAHIKTLLHAS